MSVVCSQALHLHYRLASVIQIDRETPSGMAGHKPKPAIAALDSAICSQFRTAMPRWKSGRIL